MILDDKTKDFYDSHKDEIHAEIEEDWDESYLSEMFYNTEDNWNNGDQTSGQYCYEEIDISSMLEDIFNYLREEADRCSHCARLIQDDKQITDFQDLPYGDSGCTETIVIGYRCQCGHQELY